MESPTLVHCGSVPHSRSVEIPLPVRSWLPVSWRGDRGLACQIRGRGSRQIRPRGESGCSEGCRALPTRSDCSPHCGADFFFNIVLTLIRSVERAETGSYRL